MSFKDQFLSLPPGPAREKLVYDTVIAQGKPTNLKPVTVDTPSGAKITYYVMQDYVTIDGIRVPLTGQTAQRIADYFGMNLPTTKMTQQVYQSADTKLKAQPMSAGGIIGGKYYSGQQVVDSKISDSDTSQAFNDRINQQLKDKNNTGIISGHMKDIVAPDRDGKLSLYGLYGADGKPIQSSSFTPHDTTQHTEYASGLRLVDDKVTITLPDGTKQQKTMQEVLADPTLGKAIHTSTSVKKYQYGNQPLSSTTPSKPKLQEIKSPQSNPMPQTKNPAIKGRKSLLDRIDGLLDSIKI